MDLKLKIMMIIILQPSNRKLAFAYVPYGMGKQEWQRSETSESRPTPTWSSWASEFRTPIQISKDLKNKENSWMAFGGRVEGDSG